MLFSSIRAFWAVVIMAAIAVAPCVFGQAIDPTIPVTAGPTTPPPPTAPATDPYPPQLYGISGGGDVEYGQPVTLSASLYSGTVTTGLTYVWKKNGTAIGGATSGTYSITAAAPSDAGTYSVIVTNSAGSSVAATDLTVRAQAAPVITTQPRAAVLQVGQRATFSYVATGSYPRTHQWRRDGQPIAGATSSSYVIEAVTIGDAAAYSVVVSNSLGSVTSTAASLTINAATPPVLYSYYPYDASATAGSSVSLSISISSGSSPFTYQWYKNGAPIAGATSGQLALNPVAVADAGKYSVTVSNSAGSATSREATLTVAPPTPVSIYRQPQSATVYEGQSIQLDCGVNGSSPMTYQWQKNGTAISGATSSYYSVSAATSADAGSYTVTVTNAANSVTSSAATVAVNPPVAPTITTPPATQSLPYAAYVTLNVTATGTTPFSYQWLKNGSAIASATYSSFSVSTGTPADNGSYSVTVSNRAGSVTSSAATITFAAAVLPTITSQPVSQEVASGLNASLSISVSTTGAGTVTLQWLKNGVAVPGGTSSTLYFNNAKQSDGGDYTVLVTGAAGSVTSNPAKLTVLPPAPPTVNYWPSSATVTLGDSINLSASASGSGPMTYQWYKDGVAIAGATSSSYYVSNITGQNFGTYMVVISNDGGVIASPGILVSQRANSTTPWLSAVPLGDVVYFLATSPSRIERYDMAAEKWLPSVILSDTRVPTAFLPTSEGVYIAYGRALARRPLDLSTETAIINTTNSIREISAYADYLYLLSTTSEYGTTMDTLRRSTQQSGPSVSVYESILFSTKTARGYAGGNPQSYYRYPPSVFTVESSGLLTAVSSNRSDAFPNGSRLFFLSNEDQITSTGGTVYRTSDMSTVGSLGSPFIDLVSLANGTTVLLRDGALQALRAGDYFETGRATLASPALRAFGRANDVFAFSPGSTAGGSFTAQKVSASAFTATGTRTVTVVPGERFSTEDLFFADGVVHVFSRSKQALLRWSTQTRAYLSAVPLRGLPRLGSQSPGATRALFSYDDGMITAVPLTAGATAETQVGSIGNRTLAITDMGGDMFMLNLSDYADSGDFRTIVGAQGKVLSMTSWSYWGAGLAWNPGLRRLYSNGRYSFDRSITYETIPTTGVFPTGNASGSTGTLTPPMRPNADWSLIATANGRVVNADLAATGTLANNVTDAAWLGNALYTIRSATGGTEVQRWAKSTYLLAGSVTIPGTPLRIFSVSASQLLVVTSLQGFLSFTFVDSELGLATVGNPRGFAGAYMAKIGTVGDLALLVRADGSAVALASVSTPKTTFYCDRVAVSADGTFFGAATDLIGGTARTIAGTIASDGTLSGTISGLNLSFSGSRTTGTNSAAGFYQAAAVNGGAGLVYGIVGADGRGVLAAQNSVSAEGGAGTLDSSGKLAVTTTSGATLTAVIDLGSGLMSVTADKGAFATTTFGGLRDGMERTDRLANISTRGRTTAGEDALIAGFVVSGSTNRPVLLRAIGPALTNFGVTGAVGDPKLSVYRGGTLVAESDNWSSEANAGAISQVSSRLGAFTLPSPGKDAALYVSLDPGAYTAQVSAPNGDSGVSLIEVYDAGDASASARVVNISTRGRVSSGENMLIAGIVVAGNAPKRILVRGIGPTLGTFGVAGALADPVLTILSGSKTLLTNDDWYIQASGASANEVAAASVTVGAFSLGATSKDAAVVVTLSPGLYTAQVSSKGTATGVALVEVYELP